MSAITDLLGAEVETLLSYKCRGIEKSLLTLPGPDFVDRVLAATDRSIPVLRNLQAIFDNGIHAARSSNCMPAEESSQ